MHIHNEITPKKELKYQRLIDRLKELDHLYKKKINLLLTEEYTIEHIAFNNELKDLMMEADCISHLFECEGIKTYEKIASFAKDRGVERVFDIGCAYGHQSEVFLKEELSYVGINHHDHHFWNEDEYTYLAGLYPMELDANKRELGISVLCLTWNCYLWKGEETLVQQCEALQRDFEHCVLYTQRDKVDFVSRYFKYVEQLDGNLFYFSNK